MPLSKQMININKSNDINNASTYIGRTSSIINKTMLILGIVFSTLAVIALVALIIEIRTRILNTSKYDRFVNRILREYDSYITNSNEAFITTDKNTFKVESFKELLDVRNNVDKPIIYNKINDDESMFVIISNDAIYQYIVNRSDIE